tara:strand:+ start:4156 stop:4614 length:459 start_codon:yes stop_codon:yes gene_type:complete
LIPKATLEALVYGFGHFGSSSLALQPSHTDSFGVNVDSDNDMITAFLVSSLSVRLIDHVKESRRVSFFCGLISHEAYNFKGRMIEIYNLETKEILISKKYCEDIKKTLAEIGISTEAANYMVKHEPDIGIKFHVENIFKQTPGPEAGKELRF